ncbi:MBL fold metallo-hydrolase [Labedella endophytica]|uniref:MBL fold metallo-hydrolase n=1 Tax=Labedella endophytica TaxID=1523160 RepID=A0A3S0VVQ3_9MICO|nr:MBL fold metallo-hydrolase [Labedella endophytica]RUR03208.1 MBL fold metallo-hydrolase [Labedella endophytica]
MSTNSTIVVGGADALLVDPAWMPDELEAIAAELDRRQLRVVGGFATHAHQDHLLWHPGLGDAPRWASERTASLSVSERDVLVEFLGPDFPDDLADRMGRVSAIGDVVPEQSVPDGSDVELITHDGHAPGHTALWLPRQCVLIAGDMLSDVELPLPFYPDDVAAYVEALDRLEPFVRQARVVDPGHGTVGHDAMTRLDRDRRYLDDMMRSGASDDPRATDPAMADAHAHMAEIAARGR